MCAADEEGGLLDDYEYIYDNNYEIICEAIMKNSKVAKSFNLERSVAAYIARTQAGKSASERVNQLLKRAIAEEEQERLATEARAFFRDAPVEEREEAEAFQRAAKRTLARDAE